MRHAGDKEGGRSRGGGKREIVQGRMSMWNGMHKHPQCDTDAVCDMGLLSLAAAAVVVPD